MLRVWPHAKKFIGPVEDPGRQGFLFSGMFSFRFKCGVQSGSRLLRDCSLWWRVWRKIL
ncbi:hypothetical protein K443DRAFT_683058 [Laccaria amethystina LaAM-08-1]|uniref:Uncharacterized protein n=1 Tax=Laccaria amethystina LaAM-08-1 TaxID=1095629 RepID=A0A0C9XC98_9AGAR|nr:hypothetical protein K443DRAFT_683058 [Laccaria amethystina LaAM-08-1]